MSSPARQASASTPTSHDGGLGRSGGSVDVERAATLFWLVPVLLGAAYLVWFLVRLPKSIVEILWDSDYASGYTLTQTLARSGDGGHTLISTTGAWLPLWFGLLTAHLPFHRQLWEIAPTLLFLGTALIIGWCVTKVGTWRAGVFAVLITTVASPWTLGILMAPVAHNTVYPGTALLGAYLLWLTHVPERRRSIAVAVPLLGALALGIAIASDALIIVTGVLPLALILLMAALQPSRRARVAALSGFCTLAGAVPVAIATNSIMKGAGYATVPTSPRLEIASLSSVGPHIQLMAEGLRELTNGYLGPHWPGKLHAQVGTACDVVAALGLLTLLYFGVRSSLRLARRSCEDGDTQLPRLLHIGYWFISALVVCAAFLFTTAPGTGVPKHESYFLTLIFSVGAVTPLMMRPRSPTRWLIPVGLSVFAAGSIIGLKWNYLQAFEPPIARYASRITHIAQAEHATVGYAGYWDASSLTWNARERILVRPLEQCPNPAGAEICPFFAMRTPSWYAPKSQRSFLLVDPAETYVVTLPRGLGNPTASYSLGAITMYVYPYDIASRLGPPPN